MFHVRADKIQTDDNVAVFTRSDMQKAEFSLIENGAPK